MMWLLEDGKIFAFFPLVIFAIVFGMFGYILYNGNKKTIEEKQGELLYNERCGGWIGRLNYSMPFVKLRIFSEFISIGYLHKIIIPYSQLTEVTYQQYYRVLYKGIRFVHNNSAYPDRIIIFSINNKKILEFLENKVPMKDNTNKKERLQWKKKEKKN